MDRAIVYTGALPQTTDVLNTNKFMMQALAYGMRAILGTNTYVDGLVCLPTSPTPDLHVSVGVGSIYAQDPTDASAYGDLGVDNTTIYKQGILQSAQQLTITPPGTSGFSQVYLVQAILQDVDAGAQVLSYFNAANPSAPFSGPANAGSSNFTIRQVKCVVALKAGLSAATGTQATPSPDAGFTGLYAITVANGATQITSANIVALVSAPFISTKLPDVPAGVQSGKWLYGLDTSNGTFAPSTSASTATSSAVLTFTSVPANVAVGMKAANLTNPAAISGGQTVLSKTATTVTLSANVNATVNSGDAIAFSTNALVANVSPVPSALVPGMEVHIQSSTTISGAATLNLNGLGVVSIKRASGNPSVAGDISANEVVGLIYDGANWQIKNYQGSGGVTNTTNNTVGIPFGTDTSTSSNVITVTPSPTITSLSAGAAIIVKLANPITGPTTLQVSGGTVIPVLSLAGQPLGFGAARAGEMLWMLYDGANWQIVNQLLPLQQNLTIFVNSSIGNDNFDGSQPTISGTKGPLQKIQTAINKAWSFPPSVFSITIQLADGTYNEAVSTPSFPGPGIIITGNAASPANVLVTGANNAHTFAVNGPNQMTVQNLKGTTGTGSGPPCLFIAQGSGAQLNTANTISGFVQFSVHEAFGPCFVSVGNHTYAGNFSQALNAVFGGFVGLAQNSVFTISVALTCTAWGVASSGGSISVPAVGVPTFVSPGNVTGAKWLASVNGTITTQGQGVNFFPGSIAGTAQSGGQYN
ncbi:hypothetical protein HU675_0038135 [Bradyrhizobium septentrionale]|uniref:hypothetical protein n=1 Tax=Bradyrhizobium septentrionale TaxID=1404411 RepID=UPI001596B9D0|nr:hypothetical protein [Bradyrhizobium septentrionale]UGY23706.1 hypothetical protein HU675_0038135 [Bradyrhizobium septentrionale]